MLSAVQDLAGGRDPFEVRQVPPEKGISLSQVRSGSAVYACVARSPDEARSNLVRVAHLISQEASAAVDDDGLVAALRPIELLSDVAKAIKGTIEVALQQGVKPLFVVAQDAFQRISGRLLLTGDTTIAGRVERVGGATSMKCLLRVPGRRRGLYCSVADRRLGQRLGQHLYEDIVAMGTATWIHRSWRVYRFVIRDFSQPKLGNPTEMFEELRNAGMSAWDAIQDPQSFIQELRS